MERRQKQHQKVGASSIKRLPSAALAALGGNVDRLLQDLELLGLLFELLVIRDLRVLAPALDGEVFHYRDNCGVEVDAIVQLRDGRWG